MKAKYRLRPRAVADLEDIYGFSAWVWGIERADRYVSKLEEIFLALAQNPHLGRDVENFGSDLKVYQVASHNIFYRPTSKGIVITRIFAPCHECQATSLNAV